MLLLSDGGDTVSTHSLADAVAAVTAGELRVDAVAVDAAVPDTRPLVGGAGLLLVVHPRVLGLVLGGVQAWAGTGMWLRRRQNRRCRAFAEQLPDTWPGCS